MRLGRALIFLTALAPACFDGTGDGTDPAVDSGAATAADAGTAGGHDAGAAHAESGATTAAHDAGLDASASCGYAPTDPSGPTNLMATPITSDQDADKRFACLSVMLTAQHDGRAPFITLYAAVTTKIIAGIASGAFHDGVWTGQYLEAFAELYRQAFENYETGNVSAVPPAWKIAFDMAKTGTALSVQNLALGVNAHVDRDLAFGLQSVGIGDTVALRLERYEDHTEVNDILYSELQSGLQTFANLYAPGFNEAPSAVLPILENTFFAFVVVGRQNAWDNAVSLVSTTGDAHSVVEETIENEAVTDADAILSPSLSPTLMATLHQLEGT
jgi:Family of unknown function (DUF5995)